MVEKTDRLYRNRSDALAFEALIEEIHLVKEGRIISKESGSLDKFMHDIHIAVTKHCLENSKEEARKGMREKLRRVSIQAALPLDIVTTRIETAPENGQS